MDPVISTVTEYTVFQTEPAYSVEVVTSIEKVPLPLNPRGLVCTEFDVTWAGISGVAEECETDDRPDTGMLYPRG